MLQSRLPGLEIPNSREPFEKRSLPQRPPPSEILPFKTTLMYSGLNNVRANQLVTRHQRASRAVTVFKDASNKKVAGAKKFLCAKGAAQGRRTKII